MPHFRDSQSRVNYYGEPFLSFLPNGLDGKKLPEIPAHSVGTAKDVLYSCKCHSRFLRAYVQSLIIQP
jgi:hypothetical protein